MADDSITTRTIVFLRDALCSPLLILVTIDLRVARWCQMLKNEEENLGGELIPVVSNISPHDDIKRYDRNSKCGFSPRHHHS